MALTVLVTRPAEQAGEWVARLRAAGVAAEALPLLAIEPVADRGALHAVWQRLADDALVMFVSPNAVAYFFAARPAQAHWPQGLRAAATGPGSVQALLAAGLDRGQCVAPEAPPFDSAALWQRLAGEPWAARRVLVVRGDGGRDEFAQALRAAGAQVEFVQAYARRAPAWSAAERARFERACTAPREHLWLLSSAEAIGHLAALAPGAHWGDAQAVASHPRIAERARRAGFGRVVEAPPTLDALLTALRTVQAGS